ncbi:zinc finger protein GIS2 [Trifolium repens]|nr:zinc finger protein GIS2 [Trifolium repens]KAK2446785.1 zinc finger protein GIS2 [Trifolium repens]
MSRNIAQVANGIIWTITCQVPCFPTVIASLLIGTFNSNVALLIAVVAQSQVPWRHLRSCALPSTVSCFTTGVANSLIWTSARHVARFFTIPAQ